MKTLNPLKLIYCLLIPVLLQSCSSEIGAWKNDKIKQSNRDELHDLNNQVFKFIKADDSKSLSAYLSKELLENNYTGATFDMIRGEMRRDSFINFSEYYTVNKYILADTIDNLNLGINNHKLIFPGTAEEMYISLFLPKTKNAPNKTMITAIYAHFNYGWKLSKLEAGPYTINGKTAPELYEQAKAEYKQGYLFAAANTMSLAAGCSRPNSIWIYSKEEELYGFLKRAANEANVKYHYPVILDKVSTKPRIIRIYNTSSAGGTYPNIVYMTKISIKNTAAIKTENDEVRKVIGEALPGIDKNKKYIIYAAYNEMPSSERLVPHFEYKDVLQ
ncbi:hypothetical protein EWM62_12085 [Mucilaginibacter terrigena]|uniref:Uncharacterized protein n=1 Tax=Mucilaginibacter terrigena TaxID=2492395 RepID=A0A4Q5LML7_9SPHI|nr:hypothetical protein [Mucilaginibacter terrigena]RYU90262.1 hypothetical protein EWM62_12085 [Mucilaginibacter terrigena]